VATRFNYGNRLKSIRRNGHLRRFAGKNNRRETGGYYRSKGIQLPGRFVFVPGFFKSSPMVSPDRGLEVVEMRVDEPRLLVIGAGPDLRMDMLERRQQESRQQPDAGQLSDERAHPQLVYMNSAGVYAAKGLPRLGIGRFLAFGGSPRAVMHVTILKPVVPAMSFLPRCVEPREPRLTTCWARHTGCRFFPRTAFPGRRHWGL
jgi:hypothetical protein